MGKPQKLQDLESWSNYDYGLRYCFFSKGNKKRKSVYKWVNYYEEDHMGFLMTNKHGCKVVK